VAASTTEGGTAPVQGRLWSARARDWAEVQEATTVMPLFEAIADSLGVGAGTRVLDVGCGAGRFLRLAADHRGADVAGLDAAAALVAIARERLPGADLREGEMERLPWDDGSFDAVSGINAFQYAARPAAAAAEAARVVRHGGLVAVATWGRPKTARPRRTSAPSARCCHRRHRAHRARSRSPSPVRSRRSRAPPGSSPRRKPVSRRSGSTRTRRRCCAGCSSPAPQLAPSRRPAKPACAMPSWRRSLPTAHQAVPTGCTTPSATPSRRTGEAAAIAWADRAGRGTIGA
jgi:SAM-dependent methyltransferase